MAIGVQVETRGEQLARYQRLLDTLGRNDYKAELLDSIGAVVESQTRRRIADEKTAPDGSAWAPWSDAYAKTRHGNQSLLQGEGALLDSIEYQVERGKVRIGAFNSVCVAWLPQLVAEYRAKYPGVEIEIDQGTYDDVIEWIKTGVVDLGFLSTESTRDLAVRPLYRDRLMCVAPRGFKTRTPGVIVPEEMRAETFVVQGDATDADVQAFLAKYRITVRATCRVVDDLSTIAMVESGFGICIMPSLTLERVHGDVETYAIEPMEYREFGIAVLNPQMMAPAVRQMAMFIESFARQKRREAPATNAGFDPENTF